MNFSAFLCQTIYTERFTKRKLLIIDEGHNAEQELLSFISLQISSQEIELHIPQFDTPEEYVTWFTANKIESALTAKHAMYVQDGDIKMADYIADMLTKFAVFIQEMSNGAKWVIEYTDDKFGTRVLCKPIFIDKFAERYLFNMADKVLIMSATILNANIIRESLGIEASQFAAKRVNSTFPRENHKIIYCGKYKATGGPAQQQVWGPEMVKTVNTVANKHKNERGIIHTHSYAIADMLLDGCAKDVKARFTYQKNFKDRSEAIEHHKSKPGSILISPSMHEGIDLKGDLGLWAMIVKTPYPNFYQDKQLAARKELNEAYYDLKVATKLVQSLGRCIRSEKDTCTTYITDQTFGWWYKNNEKIIPKWVKDSLDMNGKI